MPRNREPFSYERHLGAAELLARLRGELERLGEDIGQSYGTSAAEEALGAVAALDRVREVLNDQLDRDFPRDGSQVCSVRLGSIYYPPHWQERRAS